MKILILALFFLCAFQAAAQPVEGAALAQIQPGARLTLIAAMAIPANDAVHFQAGRAIARNQIRFGQPLCFVTATDSDESSGSEIRLPARSTLTVIQGSPLRPGWSMVLLETDQGLGLNVVCTESARSVNAEGFVLGDDVANRALQAGDMAQILNARFLRPQP